MEATFSSASTLKRHRDAYDAAHLRLCAQLKQGPVGSFTSVEVTLVDQNGVVKVERYGEVCPPPPKKAKPSAAVTPYQVFQSKAFGARETFSSALGGEASYGVLLAKLGVHVPNNNLPQSLMCHCFATCLNTLEKDRIVANTAAATLLPTLKNFTKFVERAKELLLGAPCEAKSGDDQQ